ncbi:MAG: hypothetical protein WBR26_10865 [Candidatus Acidiferrum sp.]
MFVIIFILGFFFMHLTDGRMSPNTLPSGPQGANPQDTSGAIVHPYFEEPLKQLEKRIPELRGIRPASDQQPLQIILRKTGEQVDQFFEDLVDVEANEQIQQERLLGFGSGSSRVSIHDSYLIVRHENGAHADFEEYRTDDQGNRLDAPGLQRGFLVTSGFALLSASLSTNAQSESTYRYLGDEKLRAGDTYVVGFAQQPDKATSSVTMIGPEGVVHLLTQGIAWVDKQTFHILQIRTDLLMPQPQVGLEEQTTKVDFSEVRLADVSTSLWLPRDVTVYMKIGRFGQHQVEEAFRNVHHYSDYRRYRVSIRMVPSQ